MSPERFDVFIRDLFNLYNALLLDLLANRLRVVAVGRRALSVLRAYTPGDGGEDVLIETAIEQFDDLVRRGWGVP